MSWSYYSATGTYSEPAFLAPAPVSHDTEHSRATPSRSQLEQTTEERRAPTDGFGSFVCHAAFLEEHLHRGSKTTFFDGHHVQADSRVPVGRGTYFIVDRVKLRNASNANDKQFVAIKTARDMSGDISRWKDILLEVRALLHEPLRYHPNIVHLLDIGWSASSETGSPFPAIVLEFADFGTLKSLQLQRSQPLPFQIKQKLCYDVGRGLSILHACGIVHGDLKHENVLVFKNRHQMRTGQPYTAKLADFGGAVMDIGMETGHLLRMRTPPYDAPEIRQALTVDGIKATDAYSFGMLVWRAFIDCRDPLVAIKFRQAEGDLSAEELGHLTSLKETDEFLDKALESINAYAAAEPTAEVSLETIIDTVKATLRANPLDRSLIRAQARLRGMPTEEIERYIPALDRENALRVERERNRAPGAHGLDADSLGYFLGRSGSTYDAQDNLPGNRPNLQHPQLGGFLFEPLKLRGILDWAQQVAMVQELEQLAGQPYDARSTRIQPWVAAYHLFQACLTGFGMEIDLKSACDWLHKASKPAEETAGVDYLAAAWLTRVCATAGIETSLNPEEQIDALSLSILRGHRHCVEDSEAVVALYETPHGNEARLRMQEALWSFRVVTGGTGMPIFRKRNNMRRSYDLNDLQALDADILMELGSEYEACLRSPSDNPTEPAPPYGHRFDKIYVNNRGHGLLHYAATYGNVTALQHLYRKYRCNIDLANQSLSETPLICACRSGHLAAALFCLEQGANPNGASSGEETPLHWICGFQSKYEMNMVARRLVAGGADIAKVCGSMRKDVRGIFADWEDRLRLPLTPLGRAVLMNDERAVSVLLEVTSSIPQPEGSLSPIELAALLTLPNILLLLLRHQDSRDGGPRLRIFDPWEMLAAAHNMPVARQAADPLTLQSRIVRCGVNYKTWLARTLRILHDRRVAQRAQPNLAGPEGLCAEIRMGHLDIVEALLAMGCDVNGAPGHRPLAAAVGANNMAMFALLLGYGADLVFGNEEETLLQIYASRPRTSPEDLAVGHFLVQNGLDVEAAHCGRPSPLASAIQNGYLSFADMLIAHGARDSVNRCYRWTPSGSALTVLGELLESHTHASLQGIRYLEAKHSEGVLAIKPLADETQNLSALHLLALRDPERMNPRDEISLMITRRVLAIFPTPASLVEHASHTEYGTPLTAAVLSLNYDVLSELLASDHRVEVHRAVKMGSQSTAHANIPEELTPLMLAVSQAQNYAVRFGQQTRVNPEEAEQVARLAELCIQIARAQMETQHTDEYHGEGNAQTSLGAVDVKGAIEIMQLLEQHVMAIKTDAEEKAAATVMRALSSPNLPASFADVDDEKPNSWWDRQDRVV